MSHTPGPWQVREHMIGHKKTRQWIEVNAPLGVGRSEHPVCRIPAGFTNQEDDARLIAAAPDLLNALAVMTMVVRARFEGLEIVVSDPWEFRRFVEGAESAIARARGETR